MLDYPRDKSRAKNMETGNVPDDRDGDDEHDQDVAGHPHAWHFGKESLTLVAEGLSYSTEVK